jgi:Fungal protein kinase
MSTTKDLTGCEVKRQIDLFAKANNAKLSKVLHDWKDAKVIGELTVSDNKKKAKLLQIGRYVRSGPYSSSVFNIHEEPECFIRTIAAYVMMSDEELSFNTFIERDDGDDQFITVIEDVTGKERRLQLEPVSITHQRAIVYCGTSCFRARTSSSKKLQYVAKFSWISDKRRSETDLLKLADKRGVKGVAKLFGHYRITSIADMCQGLSFGKPYAFRNITLSPACSFSQSQSLLSQSFGQPYGLGTTGELPKKRKSVDTGENPSKRSRSNSQSPDKAKWDKEVNSQMTSLYSRDESSFDNRIFRCLVISPAGRVIRDFRSILELLEALRDAIKGHRSL